MAGWRIERGRHVRAVTTNNGREIEGDEFVLCGGSWTPRIARELGLTLPIQAGKGYSLTLANPRRIPTICAILAEARVAVTPMGGALRFAGTMEIAGLNEDINPVRVRGIVAAATDYYPDLAGHGFRRRCALARAATVLSGRNALRRAHRAIRESLDRGRPCDDGDEPRPGDGSVDRGNPRGRDPAHST